MGLGLTSTRDRGIFIIGGAVHARPLHTKKASKSIGKAALPQRKPL
jgi:hypothetical protein